MCIFCAAVPATAAIGANLNAKQKAARLAAEEEGTTLPAEKPIVRMTMGTILLLVTASVVYHAILSPLLRISPF